MESFLTIAIVSEEANGKKHFYGSERLLMDRRQLIVNCPTATFYQELATSQIMKNRGNTKGEQGQKQINVRKTTRHDKDKVKTVELQISVSMTCHCAIRTIDHLSEIMIAHGHENTMEHIELHRSKCACLNKNIISPALKTDLIGGFQNNKYAIIIDESTDISTQKHLCMLVRFLSDRRKEIVTGFIDLIPVQEAAGEKIFNLFDEEIKRSDQSLANCIGFTKDGASYMVGCNNSLWSRL